jgi:hypothetical protein
MKITYVDWNLGNNFGDEIELNKNLLKPEYKFIHDNILKHELSHTDKAFTIQDLRLDLSQSKISSLEVLKFMVKHPKSFTQLLPLYYSPKHGFVYDINLLLIYSVTICLIGIISFVALNL